MAVLASGRTACDHYRARRAHLFDRVNQKSICKLTQKQLYKTLVFDHFSWLLMTVCGGAVSPHFTTNHLAFIETFAAVPLHGGIVCNRSTHSLGDSLKS